MMIAKIFRCGNGQAVQLPTQFQFKAKEVEISRRGEEIVLCEKSPGMTRAFELLASLPSDFKINKRRDRPQKRKFL
jgi:antitoxin VapB